MGTVGEVTKLGFPQTERVWVGLSVPVLKTKHGELREMGTTGNELSYMITASNSIFDWRVVAVPVLVEDVGVSMREGAALDILTGKTDMVSLVNKCGESQSFSCAPVDSLSLFD